MLDELWKQLLAALVVAFTTAVPFFLGRYRSRRDREHDYQAETDELRLRLRFWRSATDDWRELASGYRVLVGRYLAQDSAPDLHIQTRNDVYEIEYDRLTNEYQRGPNLSMLVKAKEAK